VRGEAKDNQGRDGDEDEGDDREHGDRVSIQVAVVVLMSQAAAAGCPRRSGSALICP
jgi:hypothetical protein